MSRDVVDITALVTARLPEVTGMLDLLYDGGRHLAHTESHRHPAGGTDLAPGTVNIYYNDCHSPTLSISLVHLDYEDTSEELLCQLSYAIKTQ